jgi:Fe2+ transport system protein B
MYPAIKKNENSNHSNQITEKIIKKPSKEIISESMINEASRIGQEIDADKIARFVEANLIAQEIEKHKQKILKKPVETKNESQISRIKYFEKPIYQNIINNLRLIEKTISENKRKVAFSLTNSRNFQEKTEEKINFSNDKIKNNINFLKQDFSWLNNN